MEQQQPIIESQETISGLRKRYEEALTTYRQDEQEGFQQGQKADTEQKSTATGYVFVLSQTIPILRYVLSYPTVGSDPDGERKALLDESTRRLRQMLDNWRIQHIVRDEVEHKARIAMLETVLANFESIQVYH